PGFPIGNAVIYPPQPGQRCLVLGSNQAKKPFFLSTSVFHTVLHFAHASVTFDPTGSRWASSRDLTGCPTARGIPAARPVDATARIEAIAIPIAQFRLLKEFIVKLIYLSLFCLKKKILSTHRLRKNAHNFGFNQGPFKRQWRKVLKSHLFGRSHSR